MASDNPIITDMELAMSNPKHRIENVTRAIFQNDLKKTFESVDGISITPDDIYEAVRFMRARVPGTVIDRGK